MSLIVAARFSTFEDSARAVRQLRRAGITDDAVHTFYVNTRAGGRPAGPGDGPRVEAEERHSEFRAVKGAALLGLILAVLCGAIAVGFHGPVYLVLLGVGVGGYIGTLLGALWLARKWRHAPSESDADRQPYTRPSGVMLAVQVPAGKEKVVSEALRLSGGEDIERAQGNWVDGAWVDFDPSQPPQPVHETSGP